MNDNDIRALQSRLDKLEGNVGRLKASNRLLSWALLGLLAIGAFLFILSAAAQPGVQDVVMARHMLIADTDGNVRAHLGVGDDGNPGLWLYDVNGGKRAIYSTDAGGAPILTLCDANEKGRAALVLSADGSPTLSFIDANGQTRMGIMTLRDGTPGQVLLDASGMLRAGLIAHPDNSVTLEI